MSKLQEALLELRFCEDFPSEYKVLIKDANVNRRDVTHDDPLVGTNSNRLRIYNRDESLEVLSKKYKDEDEQLLANLVRYGYGTKTEGSDTNGNTTDLAVVSSKIPYGKRSVYIKVLNDKITDEAVEKERQAFEDSGRSDEFFSGGDEAVSFIIKPHPKVPSSIYIRVWKS